METRISKVPTKRPFGHFHGTGEGLSRLETWQPESDNREALQPLEQAAEYLRTRDTPVAFPTETVYGLGADATRSGSVKGIYSTKGRPSDNPLIVHVCDLEMLRGLLAGPKGGSPDGKDLIPVRYKPLIERFWPGPLTILMPNPQPSNLALEVTAGLPTFGARMPSSPLALTLIKLAGVPLAAPSANASTKPSPTTAQHVKHDLDGRIELILDGGACPVGVESTVVDGLCDPPAVLRPGGISMDELRSCPGWEDAVKAYKDHGEEGKAAPRAPGMKYKHYSPRATVVLYEAANESARAGIDPGDVEAAYASTSEATNGSNGSTSRRIGVVRTRRWKQGAGLGARQLQGATTNVVASDGDDEQPGTAYNVFEGSLVDVDGHAVGSILDIDLGSDVRGIAQGLFSALRELDLRGADTIFVDGIEDDIDIAAAVMNRLRKAASEIRV